MFKKATALFLVFLMVMASTLTGVPAKAQSNISLQAPLNVTLLTDNTNFIIEWQNPKSVEDFAKSCRDNYSGSVTLIIDYRVNGGEWHLDKEVPVEIDAFSFFEGYSYEFYGINVYVDDYNSYFTTKAEINKILIGLPYSVPISEWLKTNNIEFRVRYFSDYWDDVDNSHYNIHSPFSNIALLGNPNPTGSGVEVNPDEFGILEPPTTAEAPENLSIPYMTLKLRWKIPESILAAQDLGTATATAYVDWKINNGPWHDTLQEDKLGTVQTTYFRHMALSRQDIDKDGYVTLAIPRSALGINESLLSWLSRNTCYFKVRYVLTPITGSATEDIVSPYSNTAMAGKGTTAPASPKLDKPLQPNAELTTKYERHIIDFSWTVPSTISTVNRTMPVITYVDYKPQGGSWKFDDKGLDGSDDYTDTLSDSYTLYFDEGQVHGVYSFRLFFATEYIPGKWAVSGFSDIITIDFDSGKVTSAANSPYQGASDWAVAELDKAVYYGFITDKIKGNMQAPITREEFSEVVVKLYEKYTGTRAVYTPPAPFVDTSNVEIYKANQLGIVLGTNTTKKLFTPLKNITREQIAAMLYRAVKAMNPTMNLSSEGAESFSDVTSIYPEFLEYLRFMNKNGIMKTNNGKINPKGTATREQAVLMAVRIFENF